MNDPSTTFQPISSESGLRHNRQSRRGSLKGLFNPYPAKADCDQVLLSHLRASFCLFNPYPAKADCDLSIGRDGLVSATFQPISSESGLRRVKQCRFDRCQLPFQPISSESGLRQCFYLTTRISKITFQPISSESGLRPDPSTSVAVIVILFNPYPAKADCDIASNPTDSSWVLFNPYPAKADCDRFSNSCARWIKYFSTHIQRKRIATLQHRCTNLLLKHFSTHIQRKRIATWKKGFTEEGTFSFSTHIQRKRIATTSKGTLKPFYLAFQPISSESGLRPLPLS